MKVLICYFSGTGNTKKIVDKYAEEFKANNCEVEIFNVDKQNTFTYDLSKVDLFGIAYPIHAFNAPPIIVDFVKKLPKLDQPKQLFIIKSSGEPLKINNISSTKIRKILKRKNFILSNEYHYVMPYNMIFRHSDSMAYKMWNTASALIPIDCKEILSGKKVKLKHFPASTALAWTFRIEHWGGKVNGKRYKVNEKCVKCKKCLNNCPVGNITFDNGKFVFGNKCIMCMRCSFLCPTDAIKIGWLNGWKVNGVYNFNNPDSDYQKSHKKYCKRSYLKYFKRSLDKIESANAQKNNESHN